MEPTFIPVQPTGSFQDWGGLVLHWATTPGANPPGEAYTDTSAWRFAFAKDGTPKQVGPTGSGVIFPDFVEEVIFVRDTQTRRYVRLPDPVMVKQATNDIHSGLDYQLPPFYSDAPLNCQMPQTVEQKLKLQQERVGDYSIGVCM